MINDLHPKVLDFKKNEVNTLMRLSTRHLLKNFPDLDNKIQYTLYNYKKPSVIENQPFIFHACFPMTIQDYKHQIFIEAKISEKNGNYAEATYSLSIADKADPLKLVRKFHFDYADPCIDTDQPVPIFHMQYGGSLSPNMKDLGLNDNEIGRWLSLPRLSFSPINLAILLDIALSEFRTEETVKIIEKPEWKDLIFDNEKFILKKYYCSIAEFCSSSSYNKNKLIRDFLYGKKLT